MSEQYELPDTEPSTQERAEKIFTIFKAMDDSLPYISKMEQYQAHHIMYLAQQRGIDLEYQFTWYLHGPFSKCFESDRIAVGEPTYTSKHVAPLRLKLSRFGRAMKEHLHDKGWLEVAASAVYLRNVQYDKDTLNDAAGNIIADLSSVYNRYRGDYVKYVINELVKIGFMK